MTVGIQRIREGLRRRCRGLLDDLGSRVFNRYLFDLQNDSRRCLWIVADGRSGTTWLSDLILSSGKVRNIFEPFHPVLVPRAGTFEPFQYQPLGAEAPELEQFFSDVFSGRFLDERVDQFNRGCFFSGRLVKDIFCNLLLPWVDRKFPEVPKVLLIRHPFAVALSKVRLAHWHWVEHPKQLLQQRKLKEDWLKPYLETLETPHSLFGRFVLVWSAVHFVTFRMMDPQRIHTLFYEDLCLETNRELSRLNTYLQQFGSPLSVTYPDDSLLDAPSHTTQRKHFGGRRASAFGWQDRISEAQFSEGMGILANFGLDGLYDDLGPVHTSSWIPK